MQQSIAAFGRTFRNNLSHSRVGLHRKRVQLSAVLNVKECFIFERFILAGGDVNPPDERLSIFLDSTATRGEYSAKVGKNHHIWTCSIFENQICGVLGQLKYHELIGFSVRDSLRLDKLKIPKFLGGRREIGLLSQSVSDRMIAVNYGEFNRG